MNTCTPKLGLGTAQWGMHYGVSNTRGQTTQTEIHEILGLAQTHDIDLLDTASAYGQAEEALGNELLQPFRLVSKTPRLDHLTTGNDTEFAILDALNGTLQRLHLPALYGYLVHKASDLLGPRGPWVAGSLQELKAKGKIKKIGVSVYDAKDIEDALHIFKPDIIQLPVNVLDQSLLSSGMLQHLDSQGIEIHARSVFLQGLLLTSPGKFPEYFRPIAPLLSAWHERLHKYRMSPLEGALAFIRNIPYLQTAIIGVENAAQLQEIINAFRLAPEVDFSDLACDQPAFTNPSLWGIA